MAAYRGSLMPSCAPFSWYLATRSAGASMGQKRQPQAIVHIGCLWPLARVLHGQTQNLLALVEIVQLDTSRPQKRQAARHGNHGFLGDAAKPEALLVSGEVEHELGLAREIQLSLLPDRPPETDRLELAAVNVPSSEVGGDYYDHLLLDGPLLFQVGSPLPEAGVVHQDLDGEPVALDALGDRAGPTGTSA